MLLGLVAAIGTGVVLAAVTAGHRADSAFPRFAASHGYDAIVYSVQPLPKLGTLREVSLVTPIRAPFHGQPWCSCGRQIDQGDFAIREVPAAALGRVVKLVSGRMPDQASVHETLASFTLQRDYGIGPGTVIRIPMAAASQWGAVLKALAGGPVPKPAGPTIALRVVGVAAAESEFPSGQGAAYDLYPTQAFAAATRGSPALPFYYVRLRHGPADFARFEAAASGRSGAGVQDLDATAAAITASIRPQAVGWWVLAALAAVVAAVVAAQALARQTAAENTDQPILSALGLSSRQSAALGMLRTLIVALAGVGGGVVLATLASAFAPVGEARLADPAPGLTFDWPVAGLGAVAAVAVVLALGAAPALRGARTRLRPYGQRGPAVGGGRRGRGGGRADGRRAGHPAGAGTGPRYPCGPGPDRAGRHDPGGGRAVRDRRALGQPVPPHRLTRALRRPVPGVFQLVGAGGIGRDRPAHRAGTRSGDRPDHADLSARDHRQPGQRAGTRRCGTPGPVAAVGR
jgi:hypothetical protein